MSAPAPAAGPSSVPVLSGFVPLHDPAKPNLVVCTVCGVRLSRSTRTMEEHRTSAKHLAAVNKPHSQPPQQQSQLHVPPQRHDPPAAAASLSSTSAHPATPSSHLNLADADLEMQLLAQKQKHALQKLLMEQELEQIRLKQMLLEKQQAQEEAAITAKLTALKMQPPTPQQTASKGGAGGAFSSPPVATPPRVAFASAAASASSLSFTPSPAPRVSAPIAPASAPAPRPAASAAASAAPSGRFSKPGLYHPVQVGALLQWKGKLFGVIEVSADHAIDGQTLFQFHVNQLARGVERQQLPIGSLLEFRVWVNAELRRYANCVKPAGGEAQPMVKATAKHTMEPISLEQWRREDDDDAAMASEQSGEEGAFTTVTYRKSTDRTTASLESHSTPSSSVMIKRPSADPQPASERNGLWELETVLRDAMQTTDAPSFVTSTVAFQLRQRFSHVHEQLYPSSWLPLWQLADCVGLAKLETRHNEHGGQHYWLKPLFDKASPMRFAEPTQQAQSESSASGGVGAGVALAPLATPPRLVHKSSVPGGPASPDASPDASPSPAAATPSAGPAISNVAQIAEVQRALVSLIAHTGKDLFDYGEIVPCITQRNPHFKAALGEGGWAALWQRAVDAGVADLVTRIGPKGTNIYRLRLKPMRGELAELHTTLEAMSAQMGGDTFDVGSVAQWIGKRLPLFKQSLPVGGWMALWKRAHAAGTVSLLTTLSHTGADCYKVKAAPELKELQTVMELIALQSGGELFDQASVAEWMGKRNPQLKARFAGAWVNLWKRADAAGVIKLETRVGPAGATHYSLRLTREPKQQLPSHSAPAPTPPQAELSPPTSSQSATASSSSAQTPVATPAKPAESSPAVGSAQVAGPQSADSSDELAQLRLRRQQRLEEAMRRAQAEIEREDAEEEKRRKEQEQADIEAAFADRVLDAADEEAKARRVEQEQAEIEAAFAGLSTPSAAEPASAAPLTQWTALASSLSSHPMTNPVAALTPSSSSSSSLPTGGLLRGTFIRWYDETFGVVSYQGRDLLCHVDQILCETRDLKRGCAVQFVIHHGAERDYAEAVQPLGWLPSAGLEPGYSRGVISHWVDDTHCLIRARVRGLHREMLLFHVDQRAAGVSKGDLTEHTKVTFKVFENANGKAFANDVRPIKPADGSAAMDPSHERDDNESDEEEK